jgi:hypothetical protein
VAHALSLAESLYGGSSFCIALCRRYAFRCGHSVAPFRAWPGRPESPYLTSLHCITESDVFRTTPPTPKRLNNERGLRIAGWDR